MNKKIMTKLQFNNLRANQDLSDIHYPEAKEWMWDYCLFLGKFTDSKGRNYDLGIHHDDDYFTLDYEFSDATVHGNHPGDYSSGFMNLNMIPKFVDDKLNVDNKTLLDLYKENGFEARVECWNKFQNLLKTIQKNEN